ncbi:MAG TPA: slipin family protein [Thermoanaerobaculia bacterium]|nr:slipin family protein [Thermoanaerobaculia bacterium]
MIRKLKVRNHERGLLFREGDLIDILQPGVYWRIDPLLKLRFEVVSTRKVWLEHKDIDLIVRSGLIGEDGVVLNLNDNERALVWIDGRFNAVVKPGMYVLWRTDHEVRVEVISTRTVQFMHPDLTAIVSVADSLKQLEAVTVQAGTVAVVFRDGTLHGVLQSGTYAFWRGAAVLRVVPVDLKEQVLDISGQEIMTADKVTLRLNALVSFRIADAMKSVAEVDSAPQALYRAAQLALREIVGARELDALLVSRDALSRELDEAVRPRAAALGIEIVAVGIRDVILPGEMKDLMNRVTEAKKAAEAALITRREETAAMRMQANTAKILESNPTLMRLRELEVLEKVAEKSNLTVLLGDGSGLSDRIVKLL